MGILEAAAFKTISVAQPEKEFNPEPSAKESTYSNAVAQYAEDVGVTDSNISFPKKHQQRKAFLRCQKSS